MHLVLNLVEANPDKLKDLSVAETFLESVVKEMNLSKIHGPVVLEYKGTKPEDWGITGFVVVAESHVSIHTFPEKGTAWIDVFSCKPYKDYKVIKLAGETFQGNIENSDKVVMNRKMDGGIRLDVADCSFGTVRCSK